MRTIRYFTITICLFANLLVNASDSPALKLARLDIKKVNENYAKLTEFSMETTYKVFEKHGVSNMIESKNGVYIKKQDQVYTKIDQIEILQVNDKIITLDNDDKMIAIGDSKKESEPVHLDTDSLLLYCSDIKMQTLSATERSYQLLFDDMGEFQQVDIVIDHKNARIMKLVLYYRVAVNLKSDFYAEENKPRLEIVYRNFKTTIGNTELLDEVKYISIAQGKLLPASKYAAYKLIDLRNETRFKKKT